MQFEFQFWRRRTSCPVEQWLATGSRRVRLRMVRHPRARRYVLRLSLDGSARVTIPRGGGITEARRFAEKHVTWLERQLLRQAVQSVAPRSWSLGTEILFRGERVRLEPGLNGESGWVRFGAEALPVSDGSELRPAVERHLRKLAEQELPGRLMELAAAHRYKVRRISVRNQRSRWGSCSRHGTISLNWRLVQVPFFVRDYILLHELAHLEVMNHSAHFWREVERLCPEFESAERWLKKHADLLR